MPPKKKTKKKSKETHGLLTFCVTIVLFAISFSISNGNKLIISSLSVLLIVYVYWFGSQFDRS